MDMADVSESDRDKDEPMPCIEDGLKRTRYISASVRESRSA